MTCLGAQPNTQVAIASEVIANVVPVPDLVETAVSNPPSTANSKGTFQATDTVLNQGSGDAGASVTRYYLSLDTTRNGGDKLLKGTRAVPALASGDSSTGNAELTVPATIANGTYYLLACADDTKLVAESNESNNCTASSTTITISTEKVLYSFKGAKDGANPSSGLITDNAGNLYGVTYYAGAGGYGTVFELTPKPGGGWAEMTLYAFLGGSGGNVPYGGLVSDNAGNLYGVTQYGGGGACGSGCGTVFSLKPNGGGWTKSTIYSFAGGDGADPCGALILDKSGNLYGTTEYGGTYGIGTVFELSHANGTWTETVLHSFSSTEGNGPLAGLISDSSGNLYGTATYGGSGGAGTAFELTQSNGNWTETVLHSFNYSDGYSPTSSLIFGGLGNLYGTASGGGAKGLGTVYELSPLTGILTTLYNFQGAPDGSDPYGTMVFDKAGNLYGTTSYGGSGACKLGFGYPGCGTAFELVPGAGGSWTETLLYTFMGGSDGWLPQFGLVLDGSGNLYSTTGLGGVNGACGGNGCGVVFEIPAAH
jgi:uncharacterized repeat protein (TIGR03803 family)